MKKINLLKFLPIILISGGLLTTFNLTSCSSSTISSIKFSQNYPDIESKTLDTYVSDFTPQILDQNGHEVTNILYSSDDLPNTFFVNATTGKIIGSSPTTIDKDVTINAQMKSSTIKCSTKFHLKIDNSEFHITNTPDTLLQRVGDSCSTNPLICETSEGVQIDNGLTYELNDPSNELHIDSTTGVISGIFNSIRSNYIVITAKWNQGDVTNVTHAIVYVIVTENASFYISNAPTVLIGLVNGSCNTDPLICKTSDGRTVPVENLTYSLHDPQGQLDIDSSTGVISGKYTTIRDDYLLITANFNEGDLIHSAYAIVRLVISDNSSFYISNAPDTLKGQVGGACNTQPLVCKTTEGADIPSDRLRYLLYDPDPSTELKIDSSTGVITGTYSSIRNSDILVTASYDEGVLVHKAYAVIHTDISKRWDPVFSSLYVYGEEYNGPIFNTPFESNYGVQRATGVFINVNATLTANGAAEINKNLANPTPLLIVNDANFPSPDYNTVVFLKMINVTQGWELLSTQCQFVRVSSGNPIVEINGLGISQTVDEGDVIHIFGSY